MRLRTLRCVREPQVQHGTLSDTGCPGRVAAEESTVTAALSARLVRQSAAPLAARIPAETRDWDTTRCCCGLQDTGLVHWRADLGSIVTSTACQVC